MADLSTYYLGIELKNPIIASSSSLTSNISKLKKIEEAGAGAVVLKSLFEEQVLFENKETLDQGDSAWHTEVYDYINKISMEYGPDYYIKLIKDAKKELSIPVIASLNCISDKVWIDYSKKIEDAGADALELNLAILPNNPDKNSLDIENLYIEIIKNVRKSIKLPLSIKIGPFFTNLSNIVQKFSDIGINGIVLFNRFYNFDIDIEKIKLKPANILSSPTEMYTSLRWTSLLSGQFEFDIAASTGIYNAESVIKFLLGGATVCQICSVLYKNGIDSITNILKGIEEWMNKKNYKTISDFRGLLSRSRSEYPESYERLQYIKGLTGIE